MLRSHGCHLSMDAPGTRRAKVLIGRVRRRVWYERLCITAYGSVTPARANIAQHIGGFMPDGCISVWRR